MSKSLKAFKASQVGSYGLNGPNLEEESSSKQHLFLSPL